MDERAPVLAADHVTLILGQPRGFEGAFRAFANKRSVSWKDLIDTALIRVGAKTAIRTIIEDAVAAARLPLNWQYEVQHVETAVNLVEVGLGLAVVPKRGRGLASRPRTGGHPTALAEGDVHLWPRDTARGPAVVIRRHGAGLSDRWFKVEDVVALLAVFYRHLGKIPAEAARIGHI